MSRASRVLASASLGYVQMALSSLLALWFTPFLFHRIGTHDFALWAVGAPILTYIGLVDFGVIALLQRDVAFALGAAGGDYRRAGKLPEMVGKTVRLVLCQMPVLVVAAVVVWVTMPAEWAAMRWPFGIVLLALVLSFPLRMNHALLMGVQDLSFVARVGLASWIASSVVSVVLVVFGWGLFSLAASWSLNQLGLGIVFAIRVRTRFREIAPGRMAPISRAEFGERLGRGAWVVLAQLSVILLNGTDLVVIAAVMHPDAVAPYTITDKIVTMFANVPALLLATAQPALSELRSSGDRARLRDVCISLTHAVLLLSGFIAIVTIAVDRGFVGWWIGPQQFAGETVAVLLALGLVLNNWIAAMTYTLFAFGHERRISLTTAGMGAATLVAMVPLTYALGLVGAAVGAIVGFVAVGAPAYLVAVAQETETTVGALLRSLLPWAWRFAPLAFAFAFASRLWVPHSFVGLAAATVVTTLLYVGVMAPLVLRGPLGTYVRPRLATIRARLR